MHKYFQKARLENIASVIINKSRLLSRLTSLCYFTLSTPAIKFKLNIATLNNDLLM